MTYFSDLGLAEPLLRALAEKGYNDPTPIQRQAIPSLIEGRDLLGLAQTGTGKTAAFALPSLHRLALDPQPRKSAACRMLVLSPTRELAAQIADNMRFYGKHLKFNIQCVFGGVPVGKQSRALVGGCDVLVATPGRLLDLIDQRALTLRHVEIFVLDEADQMMDLGFIHALRRVAALLPKARQSLFFSATMPQAIAELGKQFINNPVIAQVTPTATTADRVEQQAIFLNQAEKQALLTLTLREGLKSGEIDRTLVFTRTKHGADRVVRHLAAAGINAAAIHGNKSQPQRTAAIQGFRSGSVPVLVATDIAARGIDIPGVSHVFNYEIPNVPEQYVHRIGRTARAGASGIALSFVAPDEKPFIRDIEKLTGVKLTVQSLPEGFINEAARLPAPSRSSTEAERDARHEARERDGGRGGRGGGRGDGRRPEGRAGDNRGRGDNPRGGRSFDGQSRDAHARGARPEGRAPYGSPASRPGESRSNWAPAIAPDGERSATAREDAPNRAPMRSEGPRGIAPAPRRDGPAAGAAHRDGQRRDGQHRDGARPARPAGPQGGNTPQRREPQRPR